MAVLVCLRYQLHLEHLEDFSLWVSGFFEEKIIKEQW